MENLTIKNLEDGVNDLSNGAGEDVCTNSDTVNQQDNMALHEGNNSNSMANLSNRTDETGLSLRDILGVHWSNNFAVNSPHHNLQNVDSLNIQNIDGTAPVGSQSLMNILAYGSDSSSDSEPDSVSFLPVAKSSDSSDSDWEELQSNNINNSRNYRDGRCISSGDSSDSESSDDDVEIGATGSVEPIAKKTLRTEGELELDELPPVPDLSKLTINVKTEDCIQMGKVSNIIDRLVTVDALPNTPAYDLETLLFIDQGKVPMGYIYDVIGPVNSPIYVIRFNSKEVIEAMGIVRGLPVYSAPKSEHTQFVFLKELLRMKGSDASWQGDNEVPIEFVDFSDDDIEVDKCKQAQPNQKVTNSRRKKRNSRDRHKIFESNMNLKNEVNNARYNVRDVIEPTAKRDVSKRNPKLYYHHPPPCHIRPYSGFNSYAAATFTPSPNFNMINMPPPMFNVSSYPIMAFPPNPHFPPPTFGAPVIPPLPHSQHVPAPSTPPGYPMLPPSLQMPICKPTPRIPKMHLNTGVVPKVRLPKHYAPPPGNYHNPNNLGAPMEMHHFANNTWQNVATSFGSQPYNTATGAYNKGSPNNGGAPPFNNPN